MSDSIANFGDRLSEVLAKNAPSMMQRMIAAMQLSMAGKAEISPFTILLLKQSSASMAQEYEKAMREAFAEMRRSASAAPFGQSSTWLSIDDEADAQVERKDLERSSLQFDRFRGAAAARGISGMGPYGTKFFLAAFKAAFERSHFDPAQASKVMPYARQALDAELVRLYERLESLVNGGASSSQDGS